MEFLTIRVPVIRANCYIVLGKNACAVIDPTITYAQVLTESGKSKVEAVLITHGHYDHISELQSFADMGVPVYLHRNAIPKLTSPALNCGKYYEQSFSVDVPNKLIKAVSEGDVVNVCGHTLTVHEFPGHTDCCLGYENDGKLFAGDFAFGRGIIGRTDLPTASEKDMQKSLKRLDSEFAGFTIYPGHGAKFVVNTAKNSG
ncbi:MAG: MBL fold metallo-hydrolase [Firmicutes bacterium]|nr:MBL fold metallo-hydrolase [Bacillota bacterium]